MSSDQTGIIAVPELEVVVAQNEMQSRFCPSNDFAGRSARFWIAASGPRYR
jgi:hypothetical protein